MKKNIIFSALVILMISACAPAPPVPLEVAEDVPGFLSGLWHGLIIFFSFIGSLFDDDIGIYAAVNNGGWYDFGFFLGVGAIFGSGVSSTR